MYDSDEEDEPEKSRRWYHWLPLLFVVYLLLIPYPSLILVIVEYYLIAHSHPIRSAFYLLIPLLISFLAFSSLIVCIVRDPGAPSEGLNAPSPTWCYKCQAPKPERTHHCSSCGRCILKMDHHCPWLGQKCVGYRTYPAFVHFLTCTTFLPAYCSLFGFAMLYDSFYNPYGIREYITFHALFLALAGAAFTLVMGSFWGYHVYLVSTNQSTVEQLSPYLLLRHLPVGNEQAARGNDTAEDSPLDSPPSPLSPSEMELNTSYDAALSTAVPLLNATGLAQLPPRPFLEHELSYRQRRLVRGAASRMKMYNVGFVANWMEVYGRTANSCGMARRKVGKWEWWLRTIWYGGFGAGDGVSFPRNPKADSQLSKLALALHRAASQD